MLITSILLWWRRVIQLLWPLLLLIRSKYNYLEYISVLLHFECARIHKKSAKISWNHDSNNPPGEFTFYNNNRKKRNRNLQKKNCTLLSPWYYWIIFYHSLPKYVFTTKWNMLAKIEEQYSNFFYLFCKKRNDFQMAKIHERQKLVLYQLYLYFRLCDLPMKVIRFLIERKWIRNTCMYHHR